MKSIKNIIQSETRVWKENGEIHIQDIPVTEGEADLTPHPTQNRIVLLNGEPEIIFSQEIDEADDVPIDIGIAVLKESTKKMFMMDI